MVSLRPYGGLSLSLRLGTREKNAWISETTWTLVEERISVCRDPVWDQSLIRRLVRSIVAILKGYRRRQAEEAGLEAEKLLGSDPPLHQEAWKHMKGWYWAAVNCVTPPAWVTLNRIRVERVDL